MGADDCYERIAGGNACTDRLAHFLRIGDLPQQPNLGVQPPFVRGCRKLQICGKFTKITDYSHQPVFVASRAAGENGT